MRILAGFIHAVLILSPLVAAPDPHQADIVVCGGTSGGTMASLAAARESASVILIEPGRHLGGMLTGGLGRTDMDRQQQIIGGFAREFFEREGYITVNVEPYEIPYRALLPRQDECRNLLVCACVSASHMACSSIRMEPQYMILGQSAGVAAALAVETDHELHQVDLEALQSALRNRGQILHVSEAR